MMNKKGQSLIMFVLLLPVMLMIFALIIDVGLMYNAKIKGEALLEEAIKDNKDVEEYFEINDIDIDNIKFDSKNGNSCVIIKYRIDSVFGSLVGIREYEISVNNCE